MVVPILSHRHQFNATFSQLWHWCHRCRNVTTLVQGNFVPQPFLCQNGIRVRETFVAEGFLSEWQKSFCYSDISAIEVSVSHVCTTVLRWQLCHSNFFVIIIFVTVTFFTMTFCHNDLLSQLIFVKINFTVTLLWHCFFRQSRFFLSHWLFCHSHFYWHSDICISNTCGRVSQIESLRFLFSMKETKRKQKLPLTPGWDKCCHLKSDRA